MLVRSLRPSDLATVEARQSELATTCGRTRWSIAAASFWRIDTTPSQQRMREQLLVVHAWARASGAGKLLMSAAQMWAHAAVDGHGHAWGALARLHRKGAALLPAPAA